MPDIKTVAVLGSGHGGCAAAADLTLRGFDVRMHVRGPDKRAAFAGGITVTGEREGTATPALMSPDLAEVVDGADLVMLVVPARAHGDYATDLAALLPARSVVMLNPGHTGGSLDFAHGFRAAGGPPITICETTTLTYICRMEGAAEVAIYREVRNLGFAALPAPETATLARRVRPLFANIVPAANVLETGFMNINAVLHVAGCVMNAGWIEFTGGGFLFYREGITPAVGRVMEVLDDERLAVARRLGIDVPAFIDFFCEAGLTTEEARRTRSIHRAAVESAPNKTIAAPQSLDHRYVHEDVGYGLVPMAEIAGLVGVETPVTDSLITLAATGTGFDFREQGLTLAKMGLEGMSADALLDVINKGFPE